MLEPGETAPALSVPNQDGETVSIDFAEPTVVYFYPKDDSPGCTVETRQFNDELATYSSAGIEVYGVSTDDVESHRQFCSKYDLNLDLLADPTGDIANAFGVDTTDGTADRVTFFLDSREVKKVYRGVEPDGHAREVVANLTDEDVGRSKKYR